MSRPHIVVDEVGFSVVVDGGGVVVGGELSVVVVAFVCETSSAANVSSPTSSVTPSS
jgi:hypothetical protein